MPEAVRRGDLFWAAVPDGRGTEPVAHPWLVVQHDRFNRSRIDTVVICGLTSNPRRANEPGNVLLDAGEGGLPKPSVVVVSQLASVDRSVLGEHIGALSAERVDQVLRGIDFQQRSGFTR